MEHISIGYLFSLDRNKVALINQYFKDWDSYFLNGIGGHVENGETSRTTGI